MIMELTEGDSLEVSDDTPGYPQGIIRQESLNDRSLTINMSKQNWQHWNGIVSLLNPWWFPGIKYILSKKTIPGINNILSSKNSLDLTIFCPGKQSLELNIFCPGKQSLELNIFCPEIQSLELTIFCPGKQSLELNIFCPEIQSLELNIFCPGKQSRTTSQPSPGRRNIWNYSTNRNRNSYSQHHGDEKCCSFWPIGYLPTGVKCKISGNVSNHVCTEPFFH